ncbi:MAG: PhzF family phenazine biosynthesis protein [Deltaproteobacteria bacterium]|jgi:PhzF family phenazine biosynthesis protein|nr:PhzF family phenazine biosynthesis protein [Deltaproteobacteria bacterium]
MIQKVFLVDALADGPFSGAPTRVIFLTSPIERFKMASLAAELGAQETVYVLPHSQAYILRFFTPQAEIKLGVQGAMAAAHLIYDIGIRPPDEPLPFLTQEGEARAAFIPPDACSLTLDAEPASPLRDEDIRLAAPLLDLSPRQIAWGLGLPGKTLILAVDDYQLLKRLEPNLANITREGLGLGGVAVTALAKRGDCDYYLRSFRPKLGLGEESVSGGVNRSLAPHWGKLLGKTRLTARQLSRRGGLMTVEIQSPDRVVLQGRSTTVLRADILLEDLEARIF